MRRYSKRPCSSASFLTVRSVLRSACLYTGLHTCLHACRRRLTPVCIRPRTLRPSVHEHSVHPSTNTPCIRVLQRRHVLSCPSSSSRAAPASPRHATLLRRSLLVVLFFYFCRFYSIKMLQLTRTVDEHAADGRLTRMQSAVGPPTCLTYRSPNLLNIPVPPSA